MSQSLPLVLVPGLLCSARLFTPQVEALWTHGPVTVADHRRDAERLKEVRRDAPSDQAFRSIAAGENDQLVARCRQRRKAALPLAPIEEVRP